MTLFANGCKYNRAMEITCRICMSQIHDPIVICPLCETPHHKDCWEYNGKCSIYGCGAEQFSPRRAIGDRFAFFGEVFARLFLYGFTMGRFGGNEETPSDMQDIQWWAMALGFCAGFGLFLMTSIIFLFVSIVLFGQVVSFFLL